MQLILPDILAEARGLSVVVYATGLTLGFFLWLLGWWGHRFWIVLFTTVIAGIAGLFARLSAFGPVFDNQPTGQPLVAGLLLAIAAGVMALALARLMAFAAAGAVTMLVVRAMAPGWDEPLLSFLAGGLLGLLLFRAWTMALTSLGGALLMVYCGLGLADRFQKLDALLWAEKRAMLLNSIIVGLTLLGFVAQFVIERIRLQREKMLRDKEELERAKKELEQRYKRRAARGWWPWGAPAVTTSSGPKKAA